MRCLSFRGAGFAVLSLTAFACSAQVNLRRVKLLGKDRVEVLEMLGLPTAIGGDGQAFAYLQTRHTEIPIFPMPPIVINLRRHELRVLAFGADGKVAMSRYEKLPELQIEVAVARLRELMQAMAEHRAATRRVAAP